MCGSVNNNTPRPVVANNPATPPACEQKKLNSPELNPIQQQLQTDKLECKPAAKKAATEQARIDAKENSINTLQTKDSCGLSREQMVQALNGAGVGGGALSHASDAEVKGAYDKLREAAQVPGHHAFKLKIGGKKFKVNMNVASDGKITSLNVKKVKKHHGLFGSIGDVFKKSFDFGKDVFKKGLDFGKDVLKGGLDIGKNLVGGALKNIPGVGNLLGGLIPGGQGGQQANPLSGLLP